MPAEDITIYAHWGEVRLDEINSWYLSYLLENWNSFLEDEANIIEETEDFFQLIGKTSFDSVLGQTSQELFGTDNIVNIIAMKNSEKLIPIAFEISKNIEDTLQNIRNSQYMQEIYEKSKILPDPYLSALYEDSRITKNDYTMFGNLIVLDRYNIKHFLNNDSNYIGVNIIYDYNEKYYSSTNREIYIRSILTELENYEIPVYTKSLAYGAFANHSLLQSINLRRTLELIEERAFYNCTSLTDILFIKEYWEREALNSIKSVGNYAFKGCTNLREIRFGENLEFIGRGAFEGCDNLRTVYIEAVEPPRLLEEAFTTMYGFRILVPYESVHEYHNHPDWSMYEEYIVGF